jgi:peptidoglycan DL-endopeptidase LytE
MFRSPSRLFAPLALVACAIAILVIVNGNSVSSPDTKTSGTSSTATSTTTTAKQGTKKARRSYVVKPGDVMSQIAIKTGVPLDTLLRLNPNVDAQSLRVGQKLKLVP